MNAIRRAWRSLGPWLTPMLVALEVLLVVSGALAVRDALVIGLCVEAFLWLTTASRVAAGVLRFRAGRADGTDVWRAAEDGLSQVVPRPFARALLIEPRMLVSLVRWASASRRPVDGTPFGYGRQIRPLLAAVIGLVVIEGAVLEPVVWLISPGWGWAIVALHVYGILWLLGFYASVQTRPHVLTRDVLRLHDGVFSEVVVPRSAIMGVRRGHRSNFGRSRFRVLPGTREALFALGDATLELRLDPSQPVLVDGVPTGAPVTMLHITVDEPERLLAVRTASA